MPLKEKLSKQQRCKVETDVVLPKGLSGMASDIPVCFRSNCTNWLSCPPWQPPACFLGPCEYNCSNIVPPWQLGFPASPEDRGRLGALSHGSALEPLAPACIPPTPETSLRATLRKEREGKGILFSGCVLFSLLGKGSPLELLWDGKGLGNTSCPPSVHDPLP